MIPNYNRPQFSLRALLLFTAGTAALLGVSTAVGLHPLHLLLAMFMSALTAMSTIGLTALWRHPGARAGAANAPLDRRLSGELPVDVQPIAPPLAPKSKESI